MAEITEPGRVVSASSEPVGVRYGGDAIAVLFDGQGIFGPGMGEKTYRRHAASREVFDQASEAVGINLARVCFGNLIHFQDESRIIQPAIVTVSLAEYEAWREINGEPDVVTGLSLGMYSAMAAAGIFDSYADTVEVVAHRARLMYEVSRRNPGRMAGVIGLVQHELEPIVHSAGAKLAVIRDRMRHSFVVTGREKDVEQVEKEAKSKGARRWENLSIGGAFHFEHQEEAKEPFKTELEAYTLHNPSVRLLGNNALYLSSVGEAIEHALDQFVETSDWDAVSQTLAIQGIRRCIEFGPDEKRGLARQMVKNYGIEEIRFPEAA